MYRACEIVVYRHYTSNLNEPEIFNKEKWAKKKLYAKLVEKLGRTKRERQQEKKGQGGKK